MTKEFDSPWVDRFLPLLDLEEIRRRSRSSPQPVTGLQDVQMDVACEQLKEALSAIFVPTQRCCEILQRFIGIAVSHCLRFYPSQHDFRANSYATNLPDCTVSPICFTGPSGVGKSEVIKALIRILPPKSSIRSNPGDTEFELVPSWNILVGTHKTYPNLMAQVLPRGFLSREEHNRKHAFQSGVALLTADEFQSLTLSNSAHALVTLRLRELTALQLPLIFTVNYSAVRKLMRRPEEDRQRLLANPLILEAELPNSEAWYQVISEYQAVCHECLDIDPQRDGDLLHSYSAGIKRLLVDLLDKAYRIAREDGRHKATPRDIENAYISTAYTTQRNIAELRIRQWITGQPSDLNLWCPFDLPRSTIKQFADHAKSVRAKTTAEALLLSSMTANERKAHKSLSKSSGVKKSATQIAEIIELSRQGGQTSSELLKNANKFNDQFKDKS